MMCVNNLCMACSNLTNRWKISWTFHVWLVYIYIYNRFPKMEGGLPLNHPFLFGIFHYKPTFWGSTIYGYLYIYMCMYVYAYIYIYMDNGIWIFMNSYLNLRYIYIHMIWYTSMIYIYIYTLLMVYGLHMTWWFPYEYM